MAKYRPLVVRVARESLKRYGAHDPDTAAEDVAGEVFAELIAQGGKALSRFGAPWNMGPWLGIIARRRSIRVVRGAARVAPNLLEEPGQVAAGGRSVASDLAEVEHHDIVREHLEQLRPRDRLALQLFYQGGRSYEEVATVLGLPVERIGTLLGRARRRLARSLTRCGPSTA